MCHKSIKVIIISPLSSSDALLIRVATQTSFSLSRYGAHALAKKAIKGFWKSSTWHLPEIIMSLTRWKSRVSTPQTNSYWLSPLDVSVNSTFMIPNKSQYYINSCNMSSHTKLTRKHVIRITLWTEWTCN